MPEENKGWPPVLLVSASGEHTAQIIKGMHASGFNEIVPIGFTGSAEKANSGDFGLIVVDWGASQDEAAELVESLHTCQAAVLTLVPRIDQQVVRAIKCGSDAVALLPADLPRIGLPAILAFDRARLRQALTHALSDVREQRELGNSRIRSIVHDLKNPLTVTMGNLQVIQSTSKDLPELATKMIANAMRGCRLQLTMMSNLSDLIKIEEGRFHPKLEAIEAHPIVEKMFEEFKSADQRREYTLMVNSKQPVIADRVVLERVVQNLFGHAMHYTRDGDKIDVTVTHDKSKGMVSIVVGDNGEAIPQELGNIIFECAVKALDDSNHTRWDRGMMLAYSRLAMRAMGGEAELDGIHDEGARIRITLPAAGAQAKSGG